MSFYFIRQDVPTDHGAERELLILFSPVLFYLFVPQRRSPLVEMVEKSPRNSVRYDIGQALRQAGVLSPQPLKRLRRLPHIFSRTLELPVRSDSRVEVQEDSSAFTFKVALPSPLPALDRIRAQIIHIIPGITMVCVAGVQLVTAHLEELDIPLWRIRLPESSLPEASTAACDGDGLLVLTVPKSSASPSLLQPYQVSAQNSFS
ncbi:hypothetical protein L7F22_055885 [Adiantum nelumboides]|nr:hypothetical protein [Adiantum nelumboides]